MTVLATPDYFRQFAAYNGWANRRLFDAAFRLDDAAYRKNRGAFFGSIHNTLNHLVAGDRIWLARLAATEHGIARLDQILHDDPAQLRRAREAEDARIVEFCAALDEARIASILHYRTMSAGGRPGALPVATVLAHLFNHQTHHRGQVHAMLTQELPDTPPLDLLIYMMETG